MVTTSGRSGTQSAMTMPLPSGSSRWIGGVTVALKAQTPTPGMDMSVSSNLKASVSRDSSERLPTVIGRRTLASSWGPVAGM